MVFPFADDYSFGILQSGIHWLWFTTKCSTLTERFRYTSDTVFDTCAVAEAVRVAYGMKPAEDILAFLLKLNLEFKDKESDGKTITPPGLPAFVEKPKEFISKDCVKVSD